MIKFSALRDHLRSPKSVVQDTGWRSDAMPPRYGPFPYTRPALTGWEWRCFILQSTDGRNYRALCEVAPGLGKWKAMLVEVRPDAEVRAILRFEDQPGKRGGGLHVHADCGENAEATGAQSVNMAYTLPDHDRPRRRHGGWTKALFCQEVGRIFGTAPIGGQEEMDV